MKPNTLINWLASLSPSISHSRMPQFIQAYVRPCIINEQAHIIYPRGLSETDPQLFRQLSHYYSSRGYLLKEDQRTESENNSSQNKRRSWAPVILFTAGLLFESSAQADIEIDIDDHSALNQQKNELQLISNHSILSDIRDELNISPLVIKIENATLKGRTATALYKVLISHYQLRTSDPKYIKEDLKKMADYYSNYPEVVSLFAAINDKNWQLNFDENNWTTIASGNMINIEQAEVRFNTRSAAQLRLNDSCKQNPVCIASPADALLHELLHVHSIFNNTETFLAQGGMNNVLYPYQHERTIIKQERELYKKMSNNDGIKRPYRHSHAGRIVKANCSTCIK